MKKTENTISDCQSKLWEIKAEIQSFSILFTSLGPADLSGDSLFGVGLALKRASKKLEKVLERLAEHGAD